MKATIYKNILSTSTGFIRSVDEILGRVKEGKSKDLVEAIRLEEDKEKRNRLKKELPSICFSGEFSSRSDKSLKKHSGLICLDFDGFPDEETLADYRNKIEEDEYTFAVFTSPSGNGLKVLFKIPECDALEHKEYFEAIESYFSCEYFDVACSNVSRVCYESYDPEIYINKDSKLWEGKEEKQGTIKNDQGNKMPIRDKRLVAMKLQTWFHKNYSMTEGNRNNNLFKLAIAMNDFGVSKRDAEFSCLQYEQPDFKADEIIKVVESAYDKGFATRNTKYFEDNKTNYLIERKIKNGATENDIIEEVKRLNDKLNLKDQAEEKEYERDVKNAINGVKAQPSVSDFWEYNQNGNVKILPHKFKEFLEQNGFIKIYPSGSQTSIFVKKESNIIENISTQIIKDFVLDYLLTNIDEFGTKPYDHMASNTSLFDEKYLLLLNSVEVNFKKDTAECCYLYFRNCALEIKKNEINQIDYLDLDGFIWRKQIIDRDFNLADHHDSEYRTFLWKISGDNRGRYNSLKSVIGYMSHSWKSKAQNKAVIFNDEVISENPNGGSGKGLFCSALGQIKRVAVIDGKQFDPKKSFAYQTVGVDTQVLVYDDVQKNFNFEALFSVITEGITLEKKNKDAIKIPVEDSPKILITTNYTIGGVGGSHERRKFEVELSAFFGSHRSPEDYFGHLLFDDWDDAEWLSFDNYMIQCIQYFLQNGLVKHLYVNLEERKFIKETSHEFYEWAFKDQSIDKGIRHRKKELYYKFIEEYPDFKRWLTQKAFSKWVDVFGKFAGIEIVKGKSNGERWVLLKTQSDEEETFEIIEQNKDEELPF